MGLGLDFWCIGARRFCSWAKGHFGIDKALSLEGSTLDTRTAIFEKVIGFALRTIHSHKRKQTGHHYSCQYDIFTYGCTGMVVWYGT